MADAVVVLLLVSHALLNTPLQKMSLTHYVFHLNTMYFKHRWVEVGMNVYVLELSISDFLVMFPCCVPGLWQLCRHPIISLFLP